MCIFFSVPLTNIHVNEKRYLSHRLFSLCSPTPYHLMAESSPHNHHPRESSSGCSSDISVDLEPHPAAVDGHVVVSYSDEGTVDTKTPMPLSSLQCPFSHSPFFPVSDVISPRVCCFIRSLVTDSHKLWEGWVCN